MIRSLLLASVALILSESPAHSEEPNQAMVGPKNGSLVIMGGGGKDRTFPQVFAHFIKLAGGKDARIVIVPTAASSSPDHNYQHSWSLDLAKSMGVKKATLLHSHDRKTADTEAFVEPLKTATGVWFGGGRQWRLTKAYGGTLTEKEFHKVLERGGAIGGSSAGASIQGSFLARGDTSGNTIMVGDVQQGFGFMRNTAIDQHLIARGRQKDLLKVLEDPRKKMRKEFNRAELLGIGIDEDVAIVVKGDQFSIIGKDQGVVLVYDPKSWKKETPDAQKWVTLKKGDQYDLAQRAIIPDPATKK
ncbi:cyanophycinase [Akkermansiaceae bacterium]|nr:cyanophycinase [Akkermansiaceae bacterium]RZN91552.1 MAG: peptidase S51 [Verrucomicrobiaceae bacterium]HAE18880.1 peptidase S51 [Verrucomicrobiales bacterium]HCN81197.1 peptidase S51 [Verrucomicrobiales bacterium]|tara:strand:- start:514 stop:1419 length:906 start_codon:yes stop_codon:yes gene_type:complete